MSEFRRWAFFRRVQYALGFFLTTVLIVGGIYRIYFYTPANCFDSLANGDEEGVDCNGSCVRICAASTIPPKVVWAESFEITPGQYNAVAYIENSNRVAATQKLAYTLELLSEGVVVAQRSGQTILPPNSTYPIFEGRIMTEGKKVTDTRITLEPVEVWQPASVGRDQFKTNNINLTRTDDRPRLDAMIENTALTAAEQIEVVATLFNEAGNPITASQTFIDRLEARSSKDIVFTWPTSIAKTIRSCVVPTDVAVVIDLSGSMNNDGDTPPQPVTDALLAAKTFISSLKTNDQAAVITFANDASTVVPFTRQHDTTAKTVEMLKISLEAETGFTNTASALLAAQEELNSGRHNADARRVIVLLTDGLPTAPDNTVDIVAETKKVAAQIVESDVTVYAIGLGKGVDLPFIASLASSEEAAFYAPTTENLGEIYKTITGSLCESGATRIDVFAKTPTNFTPLR